MKFTVPNYLTASTPQGLRRLMFNKCIKDGVLYTFTDIQFAGGKWYAWYKSEVKDVAEVVTESKGD